MRIISTKIPRLEKFAWPMFRFEIFIEKSPRWIVFSGGVARDGFGYQIPEYPTRIFGLFHYPSPIVL